MADVALLALALYNKVQAKIDYCKEIIVEKKDLQLQAGLILLDLQNGFLAL